MERPDQRDHDPPVDGRTARAVRTRDAIVDACISLVDEGDLRPTGPRIAERAQVSVRSVFQHFDDLENLFAMVGERAVQRVAQIVVVIDPALPFEERFDRFVRQRRDLLEAITPIRRAASVHAPGSPEISARLRAGHDFLCAEVRDVFATEIAALDPDEREQRLDICDTAVSWPSWENLRTMTGRSADEAAAVVARMVRMALGVD